MTNTLGVCHQANCRGPLCTKGREVCCERCGQPQPGHPLTREIAEAFAAEQARPPAPTVVQPQHYVASWPDRVNVLEKQMKQMGERLVMLAERVAHLEQAAPARKK